MERLYLSKGRFKPPVPFLLCAKCGHNLVDKPAKNKSAVRIYTKVQLQWEKDSTTVANFIQSKGVFLKDNKGNPTTKVPNPKFSEEPLVCHCWQQCMSRIAGGGISASMVVLTKLLANSMKRANVVFVFVIVHSCAPKSELIILISLSFDSVLACLIRNHVSGLTSKRRIISILNI